MKTDNKKQILAYIREKKEVTPKELILKFGITSVSIHRHLKKLKEENLIQKMGKSPKVFYSIVEESIVQKELSIGEDDKKFIKDYFFLITPLGEILFGVDAFLYWCTQRNNIPDKTAEEYVKTIKKYDAFKTNVYIDGLPKMKQTFDDVYLDEMYYLDFYSIERFGKTKLGTLLLYAKQSQSRKMIDMIFEYTKKDVYALVKKNNVDMVGFIPPTLSRKVQLQKELENRFIFSLPSLNIVKATGEIAITQKSLSKLSDRIINARETIFIDDNKKADTVLLIDDAVGSGATLNETAKKIKEKGLAKKVIGLAFVGSFKGFEVINEV